MSLSNLYFRGCFQEPSDDQKQAVEEAGGIGEVVDKSCSRLDLNTCGKSIEQLFNEYPLYDPQKGLYKSWGDIEFPWEISSVTPNLLISATDDKWSVAQYRAIIAYGQGAKVLYIEDYGHRVSLYEANQDILAISKAFDPAKWTKICHVETTIPFGLPTEKELLERYGFYNLEPFDKNWGNYPEPWEENLKDQTLLDCAGPGVSVEDFQKCLRLNSSDQWNEARVRRAFFYREGDIVLVEGECGNALCVYIALQDIPVTEQILESYSRFDPNSPWWKRMYCVPTGRNKCLEYQRRKEPEIGYDVVEIGSKGHYAEVPVPFRLKQPERTLNEMAELNVAPRVLTQEEIDNLPEPQPRS